MIFYAVLISSMLITLSVIPVLIRYAAQIGALDQPNERKVHTQVLPRNGGIAMILGALLPMIVMLESDKAHLSMFLAILCIFVFGIWDDRRDIGYQLKFLGQLLAALIVVAGGVYVTQWPFFAEYAVSHYISFFLTVICLMAVTNAMNLTDGLDGLAAGITLLSFGTIAVFCIKTNADLLIMAMAVMGCVLGFLRFNSHPASIFMGDTGSQFLGLMLGVQLLILTQKADPFLAKSLPLLIVGLPLLDTLAVMTKRILRGVSPFKPDKNHFHHRLLALGLVHYEVVVLLYFIQALFIIAAFLTSYSQDWVPLLAFAVISLLCLSILRIAEINRGILSKGLAYRVHVQKRFKNFKSKLQALGLTKYIPAYLICLVGLSTLYLLFFTQARSLDVLVLMLLNAVAFLFRSWFGSGSNGWYDRFTSYVFAVTMVYLGYHAQVVGSAFYIIEWLIVALSIIFILVAISLDEDTSFETSPYDFLVVMVAVLAAFFVSVESSKLWLLVVKMLLLFYTVEYLIASGKYGDSKILPLFFAVCGFALVASSYLVAT